MVLTLEQEREKKQREDEARRRQRAQADVGFQKLVEADPTRFGATTTPKKEPVTIEPSKITATAGTPDVPPITSGPVPVQKTPLQEAQEEIRRLTGETERLSDKRAAEKKAAEIKRGKRGIQVGETAISAQLPGIKELPQFQQDLLGQLTEQLKTETQAGVSDIEAAQKALDTIRRSQTLTTLTGAEIGGKPTIDAVKAKELELGRKLSQSEILQLAGDEGINLSDDIIERISKEKTNAIENLKIQRDFEFAQSEFLRNRLKRESNRAITEQEEFNVQQDARLRRMAAIFGAADVSTANTAILSQKIKAQNRLNDLRLEFQDRQDILALRATANMKTITNNINLLESQRSEIIEDKYLELQENIQGLINQGITDTETLRAESSSRVKKFFDDYQKINDRAFELLSQQEQAVAQAEQDAQKKISGNEALFDKGVAKIREELTKAGIPITENFQNVLQEGLERIDNGENVQVVLTDIVRAVQANPQVQESLKARLDKAVAADATRKKQLAGLGGGNTTQPAPTSPTETQPTDKKDLTPADVENLSVAEILKLAK